jgi:hypothetical protein
MASEALYIHTHMYVCMYVCIYTYMYRRGGPGCGCGRIENVGRCDIYLYMSLQGIRDREESRMYANVCYTHADVFIV